MIPGESTSLSIDSEYLRIDLSHEGRFSAQITADYRMVHHGDEAVSQLMLFPFITSPSRSFSDSVRITADGIPVGFKIYRLMDMPEMPFSVHQEDGYERYLETVRSLSMTELVKAANRAHQEPTHFNLQEEVVVYTFQFPQKVDAYEASVTFTVDPRHHTVMESGFNGRVQNVRGDVTLSRWIPGQSDSRQMSDARIVMMGEKPLQEGFDVPEEVAIKQDFRTLEEMFQELVSEKIPSGDPAVSTAMMHFAADRLDDLLGERRWVFSLDWDIFDLYFDTSYVGAFVYTVDFMPESKRDISVSYEMQASQDRSGTSRYTALIAYLLSPASEWQHFQNLSIEIVPHKEQPHILSSSLPMVYDERSGHYRAFFEKLPQEELVFRMYHRSEPETGLVRMFNNPYILLLVVPVVLVLSVLGAVVIVVMLALKKNKMNLRE
ncbi:MAG: hypothetical protein SCM88_13765 [Bacillota bacterium]|nr:hypothetical protein [Bacillota bacterium]